MIDALLQFIAPHICTGCQKVGTLLCDNCKYDISVEPYEQCIVCQAPSLAGVCQKHRTAYEKAWCVGERRDVLQRLIGNYKFQNAKAAHRPLAQLLDERLPQLPANAVLVPVPTLSRHIRERGYDHVDLITRELAKWRGLAIERIIERSGNTVQHHADRRQRISQALKAFTTTQSVDPEKTYIILDDVVTTGATIGHMAQLLKTAGAQTIWVAVIARQPLD